MNYFETTLRAQARTTLSFRFDLIVNVLRNIVTVLCLFALWTALFAGKGVVAGVDRDTMLVYVVASTILGVLLTMRVEEEVATKIYNGDIALMLARPLSYPYTLFMDSVAETTVHAAIRAVPYVVVAAILFSIHGAAPVSVGVPLVISVVLSYLLVFLYQLVFGALVFWTMDMAGLFEYRTAVMMVFSGALVPLYFFPDWLAAIAMSLPFQAMYHTPLSILLGKLSGQAAVHAMVVQGLWVLFMAGLSYVLWRRAVRRVIVHGG